MKLTSKYMKGAILQMILFLLQIYKGLDVVTAKATKQERDLIHHHLLDILEPHQNFTVVDFRNRALKIVSFVYFTKNGLSKAVLGKVSLFLPSN